MAGAGRRLLGTAGVEGLPQAKGPAGGAWASRLGLRPLSRHTPTGQRRGSSLGYRVGSVGTGRPHKARASPGLDRRRKESLSPCFTSDLKDSFTQTPKS